MENKYKPVNVIRDVIVFAILASFAYWFVIQEVNKYNRYLHKEGEKTICTVREIGIKTITVEYEINEVNYTRNALNTACLFAIGEQYEMLYDPKDYKSIIVFSSKPVMVKGIEFKNTFTKKIWLNSDGDFISFYFEVERKEYMKNRRFPNKININPKKSYLVKYNPDNPQMAYIFLDKWKE